MQTRIASSLTKLVSNLSGIGVLEKPDDKLKIEVRATPPNISGDYSTNIFLTHRKYSKVGTDELAEIIIDEIQKEEWCKKAEFVKPGFINLYCQQAEQIIKEILEQKDRFGAGCITEHNLKKSKILIEYVSANPTGPLHTGHGRAAALGSCLAEILKFIGHDVDTEYYVNDWGRQMNILTATLIWRALELRSLTKLSLLSNMYQGEYLIPMAQEWLNKKDLAADILSKVALALTRTQDKYAEAGSQTDETKEKLLDEMITAQQKCLGEIFDDARQFALKLMLDGVKDDLAAFGAEFSSWYYESSSMESGVVDKMLSSLRELGHVYEKDGAVWFKSTGFGDDVDRVLVRGNGNLTYFASDIAYHNDKYSRGYDVMVDILGADHHGYVNRIRSSMEALGHSKNNFKVLLLQLVYFINNNKRLSMSTRAGKFEDLMSLVDKVGLDATRFFYLMHKSDRELRFDLDLAQSRSKENPVYYVQYAFARICRIFEELEDQGQKWESMSERGINSLDVLDNPHEKKIINKLCQFVPTLVKINNNYEVHLLPNYLRALASDFHTYYNAVRILDKDKEDKVPARLCLCFVVRTVIKNGLTLMGVKAPERM